MGSVRIAVRDSYNQPFVVGPSTHSAPPPIVVVGSRWALGRGGAEGGKRSEANEYRWVTDGGDRGLVGGGGAATLMLTAQGGIMGYPSGSYTLSPTVQVVGTSELQVLFSVPFIRGPLSVTLRDTLSQTSTTLSMVAATPGTPRFILRSAFCVCGLVGH